MTQIFYVFTVVSFVLFQTSFAPDLWGFDKFFDLITIFIVYLAVFRPLGESAPFVVLSGAVMDSISGGPFGVYMTIYIWLFVGIRWTKNFLHLGNAILIPLITTASVFFQNTLIIGLTALIENRFNLGPETFRNVLIQLVWAAAAGPVLIYLLKNLHGGWNLRSIEKIFKYGR
jgi:rod shape-determining protein MreD